MNRPEFSIGLALSGGGVRGLAHFGVYKALIEYNLEPQIISGTSAGALVGAFLCAGRTPEEVIDLFFKKGIFDFAKVHIPKKGFLDLSKLETFLNAELKYKRIEDLPKPLIVAVSDLKAGKIHYFEKGPLAKLLTAYSCLPILFAPVELDDTLYVDGGLFDNLPISPILNRCSFSIAVNATPEGKCNDLKNLLDIAQRIFELGARQNQDYKKAQLFIEPYDMIGIPLLDSQQAHKAFENGYQSALNILSKSDLSQILAQ